jgi:hypothetical protein
MESRKHDEMQWLQDPDQRNVGNLNNVRHEASRYFSNKKKDSLKANINDHETNSKNNNIRDCTVTLRNVTSLEVIQLRMRNVIVYRLPQHFGSGGIISLSF